jgi:hypothetical protein
MKPEAFRPPERPMKSREEIQLAHDAIHSVIAFESALPGLPFSDVERAALQAGHDTLAWVLGLECCDRFDIDRRLRALALVCKRAKL